MNIELVKSFFMWCTIINMGMLTFSALICGFASDWVYKKHSIMFSITRDAFNTTVYSFIGFYKIMVITVFLVPYIALVIIT